MFRTALTQMRSRMSLPALAAGATVLTGSAFFATSPETRARFTPVFDVNRSMQNEAINLTCEASYVPSLFSFALAASSVNYDAVRKDIERLIEDENCGPVLVRLSWHASGTYDKNTKTGGSERASMRFKPESEHGANAGLGSARSLLEPIKAKHPGISYADLWSLAAVVAIAEMGGPEIAWRPGRKDAADSSACTPDGRLPDAAQGASHIRDIFYRMGFNDQEITALVGAHTIGRCHKDRSGFDGPWTHDPYGFDNSFYIHLLEDKWSVKKGSDPLQYEDAATKELMMLPSDMAFLWDKEFRKWVEIYAKDDDRWRRDFAAAFKKLQELGVKF